jgi:hypothetical protein
MAIRSRLVCAAAALALAGAGCGGAPPPTRTQADALAAIRAAREVGASATVGSPEAAYHLELAGEHVALAEQLIREGDMERASRVLLRAKADAELAMALAREAEAAAEAQRARDRLESVREGL